MLKGNRLNGQVSLELGAAFVCIFLILLAGVRIATWVVGRMVVRQEDYERSRIVAGSTNIGQGVNESNPARYKKLNVFK